MPPYSALNRKYRPYRNADRGGSSHGHRYACTNNFGADQTCSSGDMLADRQTRIERQTDTFIAILCHSYWAPSKKEERRGVSIEPLWLRDAANKRGPPAYRCVVWTLGCRSAVPQHSSQSATWRYCLELHRSSCLHPSRVRPVCRQTAFYARVAV